MFQLIKVQHNHNLFKINKVLQNMLEIKLSNHNLAKEIREFCSKAHRLQRDSQNNIDETKNIKIKINKYYYYQKYHFLYILRLSACNLVFLIVSFASNP